MLPKLHVCLYKACLKLAEVTKDTPADGPTLPPSGEAILPTAVVDEVRPQRLKVQAINSVESTPSFLSKALTPIWNRVLIMDLMSLHIAGLQRVDGPSNIGDFHCDRLYSRAAPQICTSRRLWQYASTCSIYLTSRDECPIKGSFGKARKIHRRGQHSPYLRRGERILKALSEI